MPSPMLKLVERESPAPRPFRKTRLAIFILMLSGATNFYINQSRAWSGHVQHLLLWCLVLAVGALLAFHASRQGLTLRQFLVEIFTAAGKHSW